MIRALASGFDVAEAVAQIDAHPEVWNQHRMRTEHYGTPHNGVSDIWVRYNDWANFNGDAQAFNGPHESVWYPVVQTLPAVQALALKVWEFVGGGKLGGVLITKIPPGGCVAPHTDAGWHAEAHDKFAVQLKGNADQAFQFETSELRPEPGDLYTFDNSKLHWVTNDSAEDRITMIVCVQKHEPLWPSEMIPFDMYFASLAAMQVHPGAGSKEHKPMTLDECRQMAMDMVLLRRKQGGY